LCWDGSREVKIDATEGIVHDVAAYACLEAHPAVGEAVENGRQPLPVPVSAEPVGAQRVHDDHDHVGRLRRRRSARAGGQRDEQREADQSQGAHRPDTAGSRAAMQPGVARTFLVPRRGPNRPQKR
jgi:hypothetical protein